VVKASERVRNSDSSHTEKYIAMLPDGSCIVWF